MSFEKFCRLFMEKVEENIRIERLKKEIEYKEESISTLSAAISQIAGVQTTYPIIVGTGSTRASIVNLGTFPPVHYNSNIIYPCGFKVKKRFKAHKQYKKSLNNKVLYLCTIVNGGITVVADDGYTWKLGINEVYSITEEGVVTWDELKSDLNITNEFSSIEDFMSLNNVSVTKLIESIGDVASFQGYVPLSQRNPVATNQESL